MDLLRRLVQSDQAIRLKPLLLWKCIALRIACALVEPIQRMRAVSERVGVQLV